MDKNTDISDEYKCIFVHIPKAAGSSVKRALNLSGLGHPPWYIYARDHPKEWKKYTSFSVVRNPWDRVVSAYCYAQMKESYWHNEEKGLHPDYQLLRDKSFNDCISILLSERELLTHYSWFPQSLWIVDPRQDKPRVMVDMVLRYENLARGFSGLCNMLRIGQKTMPHENRSKRGGSYKHYYNESTKKSVSKIYGIDIQIFKYQF